MADKFKVGIIGAGMISGSHLKGFVADKRVKVVWIADIIKERAEKRAREFGVPKAVADYRTVLGEADAVAVATPPFMHTQPTLDAAAAKKHVLVEKPMSMSTADSRAMAEACAKAGVKLGICSARSNLNGTVEVARQCVAGKKLGDVFYSRVGTFRKRGRPGLDFWPDVTWFLDSKRAGGGAIMDMGCYDIDILMYILGAPQPVAVSATMYSGIGSKKPRRGVVHDVDEHAAYLVRFANGSSALFEITWAANMSFEPNWRAGTGVDASDIALFGKKGGMRLAPLTLYTDKNNTVVEKRLKPLARKFESLQADFVSACLGKKKGASEPNTPGRVGVMITQIIEAALRSAKVGHEVVIDSLGLDDLIR